MPRPSIADALGYGRDMDKEGGHRDTKEVEDGRGGQEGEEAAFDRETPATPLPHIETPALSLSHIHINPALRR